MTQGREGRARGLGLVAAVVVAGALWTLFAAAVVNPVVIADEVWFLVTALAGPDLAGAQARHAAVLGSGALLYPELIGTLARLRAAPEAAAKTVNLVAFLAGTVLLILRSRSLRDGRRRPLVVVCLLIAPVGTYAAFVMPECLYFALAAAAAALLTGGAQAEDPRPRARLAGVGALLAAATLAKPHGLVLALALGAALVWRVLMGGRAWRAGVLDALAAAAGFAAVFGLGRMLITPPGLAGRDLLGPDYRAQLAGLGALAEHPGAGLALGGIYLAAVLTLLAPTLTALALAAAGRGRGAWDGAEGRARLGAAVVLAALAVLLVTVPPAVAVESNIIHLRYFDFLFPIALMLAARLSPELGGRARAVAAALWLGAAAVLAWRLPHLRPLGVATPDLFLLYGGGQEFGPFGLGPLVRPVLLLAVGAGAAAVASGRVRWLDAQAAVLALLTVLSLPNVQRFDAKLAEWEAPDRAVGKAARALCGPGPEDVAALGTPTRFVPLYAALYALKRPAPLVLTKRPDVWLAAQTSGRCVLTTLPVPPGRWERLAGSPAVSLQRAR